MRPISDRLDEKLFPITESGCWIWMGLVDLAGYGVIKFLGKNQKVHRVTWTTFKGQIPAGMSVLHRCDIRCCANPDHLFLGTQAENMRDMIRKGRGADLLGEANPNSKLSASDVLEIRSSPAGCYELARKYGVGKSMINYIKTGKNWGHV